MALLEVKQLTKHFGGLTAVGDVTLELNEGELVGLIGPNGAGKTTTLECIEGLRKYDEGKIVVNGKTGIQLQSSSLPAHIKPMEAIKLFAKWNHTH